MIDIHFLSDHCASIALFAVKPFYRNPDIGRDARKAQSTQGKHLIQSQILSSSDTINCKYGCPESII